VSHNPERKEKNCLNCNTQVHGHFCHVCGQENIETKESFWSLTKHFVYDIFHFDGMFFHTLRYIFTKPGFVARQYAEGKRASYLHPIRMYLFTSAIFFLVFFSVKTFKVGNSGLEGDLTNEDRVELARTYEKRMARNNRDSFLRERIAMLYDTSKPLNIDSLGWNKAGSSVTYGGRTYASAEQYDSVQAALPQKDKDGWVQKLFIRQSIKTSQKYGSNPEAASTLIESILHKLPYMLFVSLPFFALILRLLYVRRKNFYYSDHAVFTLYHYIFSFILLLLLLLVGELNDNVGWGILDYVLGLLLLSWPVYLYLEMKQFYRQGHAKTFGKFMLLNLLGFILFTLLFFVFLLFSFFQS
jgi:hypothetical protein